MLKKEDLWGQFSGRMATSPRTGFLPQQNTHTHTHTTHTTHPICHTHTVYTHTLSFSLFLSQLEGPQRQGWTVCPSPGLQNKSKLYALSTNPATSAPLYVLGQSRPSPCECVGSPSLLFTYLL